MTDHHAEHPRPWQDTLTMLVHIAESLDWDVANADPHDTVEMEKRRDNAYLDVVRFCQSEMPVLFERSPMTQGYDQKIGIRLSSDAAHQDDDDKDQVIEYVDAANDMPIQEVFDRGGYIAHLGGERIVRVPIAPNDK